MHNVRQITPRLNFGRRSVQELKDQKNQELKQQPLDAEMQIYASEVEGQKMQARSLMT